MQLIELIQNHKEVDPQIAGELGQIIGLLEIKQDTTAVLKLAKIIENLLKELFQADQEFRTFIKTTGRKKPVFTDYLDFAKEKRLFTNEDFHLLSVLKIIRNEEAHELNVKKDKSRIIAAFIAGMSLIIGLCKLLKKKSINPIK